MYYTKYHLSGTKQFYLTKTIQFYQTYFKEIVWFSFFSIGVVFYSLVWF